MDKQSFNDVFRANHWITLCQSAQSHAMVMAQFCQSSFAELIFQETRKLCDQAPPSNDQEQHLRLAQSQGLSSITGNIAFADTMARMHPNVAAEILEALKAFCDRVPLSGKLATESLALVSKIGSICHVDTMRRLHQ